MVEEGFCKREEIAISDRKEIEKIKIILKSGKDMNLKKAV